MANLMPKSVPYLVANEGAERFSYYGNNVILMVYMTGACIGMSEGEAAGWIHLFKGAVYFFPLFGALLADVFWGKYRTIFWLSLVYCLGHLIMALPGSWFHDLRVPLFWGLAFIALGSGGIKSCASALVGDQFTAENQHLMNRVYNWYYLAINIGAFVSSLLTPWLLKHYGPEWAFGVPGVLMGVATLIFWLGRKKYRVAKASGKSFLKDLTDRTSLWCLGKISLVFVFLIIFWSVYDQNSTRWVEQATAMNPHPFEAWSFLPASIRGFEVLPSQMQAVNPFLILVLIPIFTRWVYPWWNRVLGSSTLLKIAVGLFLLVAGSLFPLWFESARLSGTVLNIAWQFPAYVVLTIAEVLVSVTSLEFAYTQAPRTMKSLVMGVYLLTITMGNWLTAGVNFLSQVFPTYLMGIGYFRFFLILALVNAVLFLIVARYYKEQTILQEE